MAGQPYTIDCIVGASGLTNEDISWLGIDATTGRVSVADVVQDGNGNSVRSLRFNPLSTEDSGTYICESQNGSSVQTLTVNGMSSAASHTQCHLIADNPSSPNTCHCTDYHTP